MTSKQQHFSELRNQRLFTKDDLSLQPIGFVTDVLFEDDSWKVRYLVVTTGPPLSRRVLIAPAAIEGMNRECDLIVTSLTTEQVINSPRFDENQPISREYESTLVDYFGWPIYWLGRVVMKPQTLELLAANEKTEHIEAADKPGLRSAVEISGYRIVTIDQQSIGVVNDLSIGLESWVANLLIPDQDLDPVETTCVRKVDWASRTVVVDTGHRATVSLSKVRNEHPLASGEWSGPKPVLSKEG